PEAPPLCRNILSDYEQPGSSLRESYDQFHPFPSRKLRQHSLPRASDHSIRGPVSQRLGCPKHWHQFDMGIESLRLIKPQRLRGQSRETGIANEIYCCDAQLHNCPPFKAIPVPPIRPHAWLRKRTTKSCSIIRRSRLCLQRFPTRIACFEFVVYRFQAFHCTSDLVAWLPIKIPIAHELMQLRLFHFQGFDF